VAQRRCCGEELPVGRLAVDVDEERRLRRTQPLHQAHELLGKPVGEDQVGEPSFTSHRGYFASSERAPRPERRRDPESTPSFSVVVPTRGRPRELAACLEALSRLDYPQERLEVIIVDDAAQSEPPVRPRWNGGELIVVRSGGQGPAAARNLGAARAKGEFLAFTDDDCLPSPKWLRALADRLVAAPERPVGGRTVNALLESSCSQASQLVVDLTYAFYNRDDQHARFVFSNNLAIAASVFRAIGGFDPAFRTSEDRELCDRLLHRGYGIAYAPDAVVLHAHALDLRGFWNQHFDYGRGAWRFHRKRAVRKSGQLREELGFYRLLAAWTRRRLRDQSAGEGAQTIALLALWQAANAAGFAYEAVARAFQRRIVRRR
jgi:GT2 family glycosyltransferase